MMILYSMFRNGYLSWKTDHTFVYLNFRSEIANTFRDTNNQNDLEIKPTDHVQNTDKNISISDTSTSYEEYGNVSQCPPNIFKHNLTRLLGTWRRIAEHQRISWTLFYGSLLGALRNNDIIPYDSDIDILVDASDVVKLRRMEHPRNFSDKDGYQTRLVLVPDFTEVVDNRRYITCEGKVRDFLSRQSRDRFD